MDKREKELRELLAKHDFWYVMSDDHRAYVAGKTAEEKIDNLRNILREHHGYTDKQLAMIWNEYAPENRQYKLEAFQ